jgi:hypothetical protein
MAGNHQHLWRFNTVHPFSGPVEFIIGLDKYLVFVQPQFLARPGYPYVDVGGSRSDFAGLEASEETGWNMVITDLLAASSDGIGIRGDPLAVISSPCSVIALETRPPRVVILSTPQFIRAVPPCSSKVARKALESACDLPLG